MKLLPVLLTVLVATPLPVLASEYQISTRTMIIIVGKACQQYEDGESTKIIRDEMTRNLKDRGLTPLQARQATFQIVKTAAKDCNKTSSYNPHQPRKADVKSS